MNITPAGESVDPNGSGLLALDRLGNLFVAQPNRSRVLRITAESVSVYAGTGSQGFNGDDIPASTAGLTTPLSVATDSAGNLIIGKIYRIRRVDAATGLISTIAGNGLQVYNGDGNPAIDTQLWEPANVLPVPDGSFYVTSSYSNRLLRVLPDGTVRTAAGGGSPILGSTPVASTEVSLYVLQGIWRDSNGGVYFSDRDNATIRLLSELTAWLLTSLPLRRPVQVLAITWCGQPRLRQTQIPFICPTRTDTAYGESRE